MRSRSNRRAAPSSFSSRSYRDGRFSSSARDEAPKPEAVPFETLERQRRSGKITLEQSRPSLLRPSSADGRGRVPKRKRAKNAPTEMSSKHQVSRYREVVAVPKRIVGRDPRFSDLSGE
jgi:ribosomal RNA-processing protein 36